MIDMSSCPLFVGDLFEYLFYHGRSFGIDEDLAFFIDALFVKISSRRDSRTQSHLASRPQSAFHIF
jgi:hypothetical protein